MIYLVKQEPLNEYAYDVKFYVNVHIIIAFWLYRLEDCLVLLTWLSD